MPQPDQDGSSNIQKLQLVRIIGVILILILGILFVIPTNLLPRGTETMIAFKDLFSPGSVAFNTTTIDHNVTLSIGPNRTESGVSYHSYYYSDNQFGIKITNNWNFPVLVNGGCTYFDGHGEQISHISFPEISPPYNVPAYGEVGYMTIDIPLTQSHNVPDALPSYENGTITCSIQNVSVQYPP
jgi:hypothetical protein